jgi:2-polyprenyl-3-methyl-5-hydroxy-6-metoxy-1,4-benzoquinol methylase
LDQNKENIIKDFTLKQNIYYNKNYSKKSNNLLRRTRNELINNYFNNENKYNRVLDVGCGPVLLYPKLLNDSNEYIVLDLAQSNLDKIKQEYNNYSNIKYICSDIDSFDTIEKYDVIICSGSLEYTDKPIENILKLTSFLEKNGLLIASFPNLLNPYRIWSEYIYKYLSILYNRLIKNDIIFYRRKLFSINKISKYLQQNMHNENIVIFFGVRVFIQPFDKLFVKFHNNICWRIERNNNIIKRIFSTEFLLIIRN